MPSGIRSALSIIVLFVFIVGVGWAAVQSKPATIEAKYPRLSSGPLRDGVPTALPAGTLMAAEGMTVTSKDLASEIARSDQTVRPQLSKYSFYLLEQIAVRKLLTKDAQGWAMVNDVKDKTGDELIREYLTAVVPKPAVTDDEVTQFFAQNKSMFGSATLDQVRSDLKTYLEGEKQNAAVDSYVKSIGSRHKVKVSDAWTAKQYQVWTKSPVEQARRSGKPSLVDFGADGCKPCEMQAPILEELRKEYKGKVNVVFVHVRKEPVLGGVYGISVIPVQVFYDKAGNEVFRHSGFYDKASIKKKLAEMGVK